MPSDKRQKAIEGIIKKISTGKKLSEKEVREMLFLARDHTLLYIAKDTMAGKIPEKGRLSSFSVLQNACERHEHMHPGIDETVMIGFENFDETETIERLAKERLEETLRERKP